MPRKKTTGKYWTEDTEKAIVDYIKSTEDRERNRIFNNHLYVPLKKISEIYCNSIDTGYTGEDKEDLMSDCLTHLITTTIKTFNPESGKAYSYFSVSAKYWVMQKNMKGYKASKSNRISQSLVGLDWLPDDTIADDAYTQMFIERYYAFIEWLTMHLPDIYYTKSIKEHMWLILEFMDAGMDSVDDFLKIRVAEKFKERYPNTKEVHTRFARISIYEQYLHFIKEWEKGILNPNPIKRQLTNHRTSARLRDLNGGGTEKNKNFRNYDRYFKSKKKPTY